MKKTGLIIAIVILFVMVFGILGGGYYLYTEIDKMGDKIDKLSDKDDTEKESDTKKELVYGTSSEVTKKTIYKEGEPVILNLKQYTSKLGYKMLYNDEYFKVKYSNDTDTFTNEDGKVKMEITHLDKSIDSIKKDNESYNPTKTSYGISISYPNDYDKTNKVLHYYIKDDSDDVFKIAVSYPLSDWTSYFEGLDPEINEYINSFETAEK